MSEREQLDVCVVGAGLVGLSVASALLEKLNGVSVLVVDKEGQVAAHQSSHNSGVVHSGLYYEPGSLKAQLCVEGRAAIYDLCESAGIPHRRAGKLVIATKQSEIPILNELERRGRANGLTEMRRLDGSEISEIEPGATGVDALHVPEAGVADYPSVARHMSKRLSISGGSMALDTAVRSISQDSFGVTIGTDQDPIRATHLVNCAGLHSDVVARMAGVQPGVSIVPFRGEYYRLAESASHLVQNLIYPVPDPRYPFLGVHFTRRLDGTVEVGPNAILAAGREHYRGSSANWRELGRTVANRGFMRLALRNWVSGGRELLTSRSKRLYARLASRLVPDLSSDDLLAGGSGVRAQAVDASGNLVDDFVIEKAGNTFHVLNAPSPGATACVAIGRHIAARLSEDLGG